MSIHLQAKHTPELFHLVLQGEREPLILPEVKTREWGQVTILQTDSAKVIFLCSKNVVGNVDVKHFIQGLH